jgi:hypothetical protein
MKNHIVVILLWIIATLSFFCFSTVFIFYHIWYSNVPEEIIAIQYHFPWISELVIPAAVFILRQLILHVTLLLTRITNLTHFLLFLLLPPVLGFLFCQSLLYILSFCFSPALFGLF